MFKTRAMRAALSAVAIAIVAGALAACSGGAAGAPSDTLRLGWDSDPAAFGYDPLQYSSGQRLFYEPYYDSLLVRAEDGSIEPGIATAYEFNEDGTVLTLTLDTAVEFADGSTLSPELVKANFDRRLDDSEGALVAYASLAPEGESELTSVEVSGDDEVILTFLTPQQNILSSLAGVTGMVVGQDAVDDATILEKAPDGSGAYSLDTEKTIKGDSYVATKIQDHRNTDLYPFTTVESKIISSPQARANAVTSGQVDATLIDPTTVEFVDSQNKVELAQIGGTVQSILVFDKLGLYVPAFGDERVRKAFSLAIDRQSLVDTQHPGAVAAYNALPADSPGFDPAIDEEYAHDPEQAKELLAEAGYPDGFDVEMVLSAPSQSDMEAIQADLKEVGINLKLTLASTTDQIFDAVNNTSFGYLPLGWDDPLGVAYGVIFGFANGQQATSEPLTAAVGMLASASDEESKTAALTAFNRALIEEGWIIPTYEQLQTWAYDADKIDGIHFIGYDPNPPLISFQPPASE
jgi:peptide/nickel transport system substrate-binding protein